MDISPPAFAKRNAEGVLDSKLLDFKLKHSKSRSSPAQKAGLRYEKRALVHLALELDERLTSHPAFKFNQGKRLDEFAIPDAIYFGEEVLTIFEIKIRHTADAWYQLKRLYLPVVQRAYPEKIINLCEVYRSFDSSVVLPNAVQVDDLKAFCSKPHSGFGMYFWSAL